MDYKDIHHELDAIYYLILDSQKDIENINYGSSSSKILDARIKINKLMNKISFHHLTQEKN